MSGRLRTAPGWPAPPRRRCLGSSFPQLSRNWCEAVLDLPQLPSLDGLLSDPGGWLVRPGALGGTAGFDPTVVTGLFGAVASLTGLVDHTGALAPVPGITLSATTNAGAMRAVTGHGGSGFEPRRHPLVHPHRHRCDRHSTGRPRRPQRCGGCDRSAGGDMGQCYPRPLTEPERGFHRYGHPWQRRGHHAVPTFPRRSRTDRGDDRRTFSLSYWTRWWLRSPRPRPARRSPPSWTWLLLSAFTSPLRRRPPRPGSRWQGQRRARSWPPREEAGAACTGGGSQAAHRLLPALPGRGGARWTSPA